MFLTIRDSLRTPDVTPSATMLSKATTHNTLTNAIPLLPPTRECGELIASRPFRVQILVIRPSQT
jgi:hypothetical protein